VFQEEARQQGRELSLTGEDLPRRRSALVMQARQPRDQVQDGRSQAGPVPVDQNRAPVAQAEVVAAHVAVQERATVECRGVGRPFQLPAPCLEPGLVEHPEGERLFRKFVEFARGRNVAVATGLFGGDMQVSLVNDGPVTFILES